MAGRSHYSATADEWRLALLAEWGITVIYYGYYEAQVGPPPDLPGWRLVYEEEGIMIFLDSDMSAHPSLLSR